LDKLLRAWSDAPAFLLSCPGPPRQYHAAVQPISQLRLPQCLLGGEAQLMAFAAANPELAEKLFFAPLPEMFFSPASLRALWDATGTAAADGGLVHLRFGGTRNARVLKGARNGLVLAENHESPPLTASRHPFASGLVLPALMRRVYAYSRRVARPVALGSEATPITPLTTACVSADLARRGAARGRPAAQEGLEIVSLAEFRSHAWAAGPVLEPSMDLAAAVGGRRRAPFVLVPWNLNHAGSPIPTLVERTLKLQSATRPALRLLVLPFNYPGQTGLIRRLIRHVRTTADGGARALQSVFVGRLSTLASLPALRRLTRVAWVDSNDPEYDWTMQRLTACGITPELLPVDDALTISAETRFGLLHFDTRLPSLRALRRLIEEVRPGALPLDPAKDKSLEPVH
jgi:hypothetical protein